MTLSRHGRSVARVRIGPEPLMEDVPPMSHIVTIQTQVRDPVAVAMACAVLQLPVPTASAICWGNCSRWSVPRHPARKNRWPVRATFTAT